MNLVAIYLTAKVYAIYDGEYDLNYLREVVTAGKWYPVIESFTYGIEKERGITIMADSGRFTKFFAGRFKIITSIRGPI